MPKRKRTEAPASWVATTSGSSDPSLIDAQPTPVAVDISNASRRNIALKGLHRYFVGQEARRRAETGAGQSLRPTMAVADMAALIRRLTADWQACRSFDPRPVIRALDGDGCNWDLPFHDDTDERSADCRSLVSGTIENLRARYNLA